MALPSLIRELLENGVHFGHLSKHWNPKMKRFIFGKKKNVYIIDLEKTAEKLEEAKDFVHKVASQRGTVLFVATKKQLKDIAEDLAKSCDMPFVTERWVGGFLTNFSTIRSRIKKYIDLKAQKELDGFKKIPNKEALRLKRELDKMEKNYRGVIALEGLPDCLFVIDPKREMAAVREARKLSIPIIALIDTDSDPEVIDYPVPGNDDAIRSMRCITSFIVEAIQEGKKEAVAAAESAVQLQDAGSDKAKTEELAGKVIKDQESGQ
jgi:small subunit ribosomal protein S2